MGAGGRASSAGDDKTTNDRELTRIGVTTPDGDAAADNADGAEDETDEHDDAHRFACAFGETARGLGEDGREAHGNEI